jgi:hypothetical protein
MLAQLDELKHGEVSGHQYTARSAVKVDAKISKIGSNQQTLDIHFKIKPDWHINSHRPLQKELTATAISPVNKRLWPRQALKWSPLKSTSIYRLATKIAV